MTEGADGSTDGGAAAIAQNRGKTGSGGNAGRPRREMALSYSAEGRATRDVFMSAKVAPLSKSDAPSEIAAKPPRRSRAESREQAINQIIDIATNEFVEKGLAGARIDEIAGKATKRKIYYYFEGKDELYRAVLERAYTRVRESEAHVDIESGTAAEALHRLIEHDVHYHARHPELVRLVMNENIHRAEHLKQINGLPQGNRRVIDILQTIITRGQNEGLFRDGIDPVDLHFNLTALSFYNVSNQFTFAHNFGVDMTSDEAIARRAVQVADIILAWVTKKD
ncbi:MULTISPECIES: TetR/AcrR family transcriptional regulator [unclassified Novosphingobium]|uniref:TetR/AcrR family transcriptional regulator n=1 Tax=unclassified Novosphingobium TaxID=2644732 RepID=UPI0025E085EF|nr:MULTISPECIES: TetR/AcrR family transcriptional regulator [unclassified Novosphingobium]